MEALSALLVLSVGIHRTSVDTPHKWLETRNFVLQGRTSCLPDSQVAGDLKRHDAHAISLQLFAMDAQ